jgi:hypothetical protein
MGDDPPLVLVEHGRRRLRRSGAPHESVGRC